MKEDIPHSRPYHQVEDELTAIRGVLESQFTARGAVTRALEEHICKALGGRAALAVPSGEIALWAAMHVAGVVRRDQVIVPAYTCWEVFRPIRLIGAEPVAVDIGEDWNVDPAKAAVLLSRRTKALVVTHQFGFVADMAALGELGVPIIEDLAHGVGGAYKGTPVGTFGDISMLSFHATKMLSSGEGGMVVARTRQAAERLMRIKQDESDVIPYLPFPDLLGAAAMVQFRRLPEFVARRRAIAALYRDGLAECEVKTPLFRESDTCFRYPLLLPDGVDVEETRERFAADGVQVRRGVDVLPVPNDVPGLALARERFRRTLCLPIYPALSDREAEHVIGVARKIFRG
jgi:perosamine synthetase